MIEHENARKPHFSAEEVFQLIIDENDFEGEISGAREFSSDQEIPWINDHFEEPSVWMGQSIEKEDKIIGDVFIFGYVSPYSISGFFYSTKNAYSHEIEEIGEAAVYEEKEGDASFDNHQLMFIRCNIVVKMYFSNEISYEELVTYAIKFDERITPVVCE